jgi:hypothetical protein
VHEFLDNPWFIGIAGGILSGLLVFALTYWLQSRLSGKRLHEERERQVEQANREVLVCLRPYVASNGLPSPSSINAILASAARQYGLNTDDLLGVPALCSQLLREVLSNPYVPADQKRRFAEDFAAYREKLGASQRDTETLPATSSAWRAETKFASVSSSITAALVTMAGVVMSAVAVLADPSVFGRGDEQWVMAGVIVIVAVGGTIAPTLFRRQASLRMKVNGIKIATPGHSLKIKIGHGFAVQGRKTESDPPEASAASVRGRGLDHDRAVTVSADDGKAQTAKEAQGAVAAEDGG